MVNPPSDNTTTIILQIDGRICTIQLEGTKHTATELLQVFVGVMVGQTFSEQVCYKAMAELAKERM